MTKEQVFVDKGSAPWYNNDWTGIDKVISMIRSDSETTVTCNDIITNMGKMFSSCYSITSIDLSSFDTSNVCNMDWMFYGCENLTFIDLSSFNTSNVENMRYMFNHCSNLTTIKGVIDMKSCTEYYGNMFDNCPKLKDAKIKNPPPDFELVGGLSKFQYTVVS